jgi:hypothetical protein
MLPLNHLLTQRQIPQRRDLPAATAVEPLEAFGKLIASLAPAKRNEILTKVKNRELLNFVPLHCVTNKESKSY